MGRHRADFGSKKGEKLRQDQCQTYPNQLGTNEKVIIEPKKRTNFAELRIWRK